MESDQEAALVEAVLKSRKYGRLMPEFVASVGGRELAKGRKLTEAIKATKNKLHQAVGSYQKAGAYDKLLEGIREGATAESLEEASRRAMQKHTSSRERLPILERIYTETLSDIGPIHSVLDLASGLHPLGIPWMPVEPDATYVACDVDLSLVDFLNGFFELTRVRGRAEPHDLLSSVPDGEFDVAFLMKAIPCLEQLDPAAAGRLLREIPARHLVVSFPTKSLGGLQKGMVNRYGSHFEDLIAKDPRAVRFEFPSELVFVFAAA